MASIYPRVMVILAVLGVFINPVPQSAGPLPSPADQEPGDGVVALAGGLEHTCALTASGAVKCWGRNYYGQLGNNSTEDSLLPVDVVGLTGVAVLSAGYSHTCALTTAGSVKCWGDNNRGELGNNSTPKSPVPMDVAGLSGVVAIATGGYYTCALTAAGVVECWGWNGYGQLGNDSNYYSPAPVRVVGLTGGVVAIKAGYAHTCALTTEGAVKCWGYNLWGQLGDGTTTDRWTPVDVVGLSGKVTALESGFRHTCALTVERTVYCWGDNSFSQLGKGSSISASPEPMEVTGLENGVLVLSVGGFGACILSSLGGGIRCWGDNSYGGLGNNSTTQSPAPVDVIGLTGGVVAVEAGVFHTCALTADGPVKCWGMNNMGELGDGTTTDRWTPVDVVGLSSEPVVIIRMFFPIASIEG